MIAERIGVTVFIALSVYALFFDGLRIVGGTLYNLLGG